MAYKEISVVILIIQIASFVNAVTDIRTERVSIARNNSDIGTTCSPKEVTLDAGCTMELVCETDEPATWAMKKFYYKNDMYSAYLVFNITHSTKEDSNGNTYYQTVLTIPDASFLHVGQYFCIINQSRVFNENYNTSSHNEFKTSSTYVYVNDSNHELAFTHSNYHAPKHSDYVIPCKPTLKHTPVSLFVLDRNASATDQWREVRNASYNPQLGFTIPGIKEGAQYMCKSRSEQRNISVHVSDTSKDDGLNFGYYNGEPRIKNTKPEYVVVGSRLQLECILYDLNDATVLAWYLPDGKLPKKHINFFPALGQRPNINISRISVVKKLYLGHLYSVILIVRNVTKELDSGTYNCRARNVIEPDKNKSIDITVLDEDEIIIDVEEDENRTDVFMKSESRSISIVFKYKSFPPAASAKWLFNRDQLVNADDSDNNKYETEFNDTTITLTINDVEISDSGTYSLKIANVLQERVFNRTIIIREKPVVSIHNFGFAMKGENVTADCNIFDGSVTNVTWIFRSCSSDSPTWTACEKFDEERLNDEETQNLVLNKFIQRSTIHFTPTKPGYLACETTNESLHVATAEAKVVFCDFDLPLMQRNQAHQSIRAPTHSFALKCLFTRYNYTEELELFEDAIAVQNSAKEITVKEPEKSKKKDDDNN